MSSREKTYEKRSNESLTSSPFITTPREISHKKPGPILKAIILLKATNTNLLSCHNWNPAFLHFFQEATDIGPVISARQLDRIEDQVERSKAFGATALTGGRRPQGTMLEKGHFYEPTVLTGVTPENFGFSDVTP